MANSSNSAMNVLYNNTKQYETLCAQSSDCVEVVVLPFLDNKP